MITKIDVDGNSGKCPSGPMQFRGDWCGVFLRGDSLEGLLREINLLVSEESYNGPTPNIELLRVFCDEATK
jgi:hypothetical protein